MIGQEFHYKLHKTRMIELKIHDSSGNIARDVRVAFNIHNASNNVEPSKARSPSCSRVARREQALVTTLNWMASILYAHNRVVT